MAEQQGLAHERQIAVEDRDTQRRAVPGHSDWLESPGSLDGVQVAFAFERQGQGCNARGPAAYQGRRHTGHAAAGRGCAKRGKELSSAGLQQFQIRREGVFLGGQGGVFRVELPCVDARQQRALERDSSVAPRGRLQVDEPLVPDVVTFGRERRLAHDDQHVIPDAQNTAQALGLEVFPQLRCPVQNLLRGHAPPVSVPLHFEVVPGALGEHACQIRVRELPPCGLPGKPELVIQQSGLELDEAGERRHHLS